MPEEDEEGKVRRAMARRMKEIEMEQQRREVLRKYLMPDAYERLMNVRVSSIELYQQIVELIFAMIQQGKLSGRLTEAQLTQLLSRLTYRREPTIEFRHK